MFPYGKIHPELVSDILDAPLFDSYRLVDPRNHVVYDYDRETNELVRIAGSCHEAWHRAHPCMNCTSKTCRALHIEMMKIEYLDGRIMLVVSLPVMVQGLPFALELIKDVTESLMVADRGGDDNLDFTTMVSRFNLLATHDAFSDLYNKNFINNELDNIVATYAESETAQTPGAPTGLSEEDATSITGKAPSAPTVVEFDIDDFKQVNDTYGHSVGDDVILYVSKHTKAAVKRAGGWVGRLGGDEFLIVLPGTDIEAASALCGKVFGALDSYEFETDKGAFSIKVSCGATQLRDGDTRQSLLDRVDHLMYRAKDDPTHWAAEE